MGRGDRDVSLVIPTLATERCVLRPFREDDVPALVELHSDREVIRFLRPDGEPETSPRDAWEYIALHLGHWAMKGYGKWALVDRTSDRLIGRVGFYDAPYEWPGCELGWTIMRRLWGQGYATEGARVAMRWGFENIPTDEIVSAIHPDNVRSIKVAERLGERLLRKGMDRTEESLIYGISRDEWRRNSMGA